MMSKLVWTKFGCFRLNELATINAIIFSLVPLLFSQKGLSLVSEIVAVTIIHKNKKRP